MLKSFYILEILRNVFQEDRSGEVMILVGQDIAEILGNAGTGFSELRENLEILLD